MRSSGLKTHNILQLGRQLGAPPRLMSFLAKLSPEYILSRYPDAAYGVPAERYDGGVVEEYLKQADGVMEWVESRIRK